MTVHITPKITLSLPSLAALMPMGLVVGPTGHIVQIGPTLAKLRPERDLLGQRFLELFELKRPRHVVNMGHLKAAAGAPLSLRFRDNPRSELKGLAVALEGEGGLLVNLSFGIAAVEAVGTYQLSSSDFPATDLTVEMLYLVEANAAVHAVSQDLLSRLDSAKVAAQEQAFTDTLTGLRNRRAMDMVLGRYARRRDSFALMHLDLDHFKAVNDTLGHAAGDHVLQEVAKILVEETRAEDTVVRLGGDEFLMIFHNLTRPDQLTRIAERLLERLEAPIMFGTDPCAISGSIGITTSDTYTDIDADKMLHDVDMALYASKHAGRAQHTFVGEPATSEGHDTVH
ncbi:MAG: GGDEF domain-containing protein [Rhodobacter sp.]|nr:GGDEF domain-containing protein [Rhodobacter sp.]